MRCSRIVTAGTALLLAGLTFGYDGQTHQRLTFLAAKQFNRCVAGTNVAPLTPLQVRYMARSNASLADGNLLSRMFRWRYYDRAGEAEQSALWVIDTRFHAQFNELERRIEDAASEVDVYRQLGRILSYLQLVTSPPHVVPVYTARFWRFSFADRFDSFRVEDAELEAALGEDCSFLEAPPLDYGYILSEAARSTLVAVQQPISGMPTSWQAFWRLAEKDGAFGDYGPAGNNFGRKTEFRCGNGERCLLLKDDPLYQEFALARHVDAVRATVAAIYRVQMRNAHAALTGR
jgi:hypothetical protein